MEFLGSLDFDLRVKNIYRFDQSAFKYGLCVFYATVEIARYPFSHVDIAKEPLRFW
jgi:hypothetical protein